MSETAEHIGDPVTSREEARERLPEMSRGTLGNALIHLGYRTLERDDDTATRARAYVAMELGFQMSGQYIDRLRNHDLTWPPEGRLRSRERADATEGEEGGEPAAYLLVDHRGTDFAVHLDQRELDKEAEVCGLRDGYEIVPLYRDPAPDEEQSDG